MNLVVLHKLADLQAAGDGTRAARIAEGLIADASTRIVYHQDESQVQVTRELLGLSADRSAAERSSRQAKRSGVWALARLWCSTTAHGQSCGLPTPTRGCG